MIETLVLPAPLRDQLEQEAGAAFPRESCGLVEGSRENSVARVWALHPMPNLSPAPDSFEIDPAAHIALLRRRRGTGREIIGCYHSHPNGRAEPSPRDIAGAGEIDFLWLIAALENTTAPAHFACFVWTGSEFARVIIE
jgi:proteasome lid subunit RPN8/RPN11